MKIKQRIVVTGSAGFLGGRLSNYLATNYSDYQIIATSRRSIRASILEAHGCEFLAGDLCDRTFCESLTKQVDMVIHCAALSSPFGHYESFYQSNFVATKNILDTSIKNGVKKFIFISTPSIYFNYSDRFNIHESESLPNPLVNHYATTKLMAENYVLESNSLGIQTIALRPRAIIGAEDTVIFPRMLKAYYSGKLKIIGKGTNRCDFTCVRNCIEAILCSINAPSTAYGEAYNITDGESVPFWDVLFYALKGLELKPPTQKISQKLALLVASIMELFVKIKRSNEEPSLTKYSVGLLIYNFTLDISKARTNLNYIPVMNTYEGINEFIQWYKNQK